MFSSSHFLFLKRSWDLKFKILLVPLFWLNTRGVNDPINSATDFPMAVTNSVCLLLLLLAASRAREDESNEEDEEGILIILHLNLRFCRYSGP